MWHVLLHYVSQLFTMNVKKHEEKCMDNPPGGHLEMTYLVLPAHTA